MVALSQELCELLYDWIDYARPDVTDNYGREPLITTTRGRIEKTTPTKIVYNLMRPCRIEAPCPLDRDSESARPPLTGMRRSVPRASPHTPFVTALSLIICSRTCRLRSFRPVPTLVLAYSRSTTTGEANKRRWSNDASFFRTSDSGCF